MAVDRKLMDILCCPITRQPMEPLSRDRLQRLNALIEAGEVTFADGSRVEGPLREALITRNGERIYPVDDGIPVMLEERCISTRPLSLDG
ncbi:MAG: Trm112 family protein [Aquisalimonadaceae bacterium]